jgi:hypothetical protein
MFENRDLKTIFGQKKDKLTGQRKLLKEVLQHMYLSPNINGIISSSR